MRIAARQIGQGPPPAPVYVIAELGVNHDGSPQRARELVELAADHGADAVKFQLFRADLLMGRAARLATYQAAAGEQDPLAMLRRLELSPADLRPLVARAHELGLAAIVTVFSEPLVAEAELMDWDAYKTASPDIVHRPLLEALAKTGKPLIVSTGASTLEEVRRSAAWLHSARDRLAFLQCVSCYPTRREAASIRAMEAIAAATGSPVGYSDHTHETDTGAVAANLGATILEKHFTYSKSAAGPDHSASLEPAEFRAYATMARDESSLRAWMGDRVPISEDPRWGPPEKRILDCERDVRRVSRQSITAARDLRAGETLQRQDITFKRPGTGLEPWQLEHIIGRPLLRDVGFDQPLTANDFGDLP
jgi:N,N'-diacetyllegionaminate synthase